MERMYTAWQLSKVPEVTLSYEMILAATRKKNHRLPHVKSGSRTYIRMSVFEDWIKAEEELSTQ